MSSISKAESILEKAFRNGRLHHAILLYGNSATALEDVAKKTASLLFGRPCARHPDLFELRPEGKMRLIKIGSASDRTGGDWPPNTMRKLLRDIRQSPSAGAVKVAIVHEADRMNAESANAFLKTLEEPPPDTTIFMLTTRPNDLLDTIRSRCIALRVDSEPEPLDDEMIEAVRASQRRALRKRLLADIEDACVDCALGGNGVPAVKISRAVAALEKSAAYMELNMPDAPAIEYFMLSSLRIWTR